MSFVHRFKQPLVRIIGILLSHSGMNFVQPLTVEAFLRTDCWRHDDGDTESRIERQLARFCPEDIGLAHRRVEFLEVLIKCFRRDDPDVVRPDFFLDIAEIGNHLRTDAGNKIQPYRSRREFSL